MSVNAIPLLTSAFKRIEDLTDEQLKIPGEDVNSILGNTMEELGELAAAIRIEDGVTKKHKSLDEPSTVEAIDLVICALSVYFARGGELNDIPAIIHHKLDKWCANIYRNTNGE